MDKKSVGFTLIELLVTIGIIGVLSSFLLANFIGVRQRARDGVRKSDLRQIQAALELYRSDLKEYPDDVPNSEKGDCIKSLLSVKDDCSSVVYMKTVPIDPLGEGYNYTLNGSTYSIVACLENANDPEIDKDSSGNKTKCSDSTWQYTLQSP